MQARRKQIIGIDLDGVLCRPPLGLNLSIKRGPYRDSSSRWWPRLKRVLYTTPFFQPPLALFETIRYLHRTPLPEAWAALEAISKHREIILVTSRSHLTNGLIKSWLKRHALQSFFQSVYTNVGGLSSAEHKHKMVKELGLTEFVDDDGRVADLLAREGLDRVFLRDWPRNRGYSYPPNVVRVESLAEVAYYLENNQDFSD